MIDGPRRCAVVGSPIEHSLSPVLHRAAYAALGVDWTYDAVEVTEDVLEAFLDGLDAPWRGLSLTMPLKRRVVPLLDDLTDRARQSGAVNTLVLENGRRVGHNTDIPGASAAVRQRYQGPLQQATILGGGATASSTLLALADLGCTRFTVLVRDEARAAGTVAAAGRHPSGPAVDVRRLGDRVEPADILVSTIPAAAQDARTVAYADVVPVVFDVVYDPWPTPLAAHAERAGTTLVAGLDLLVHQAVLQLQLMTGTTESPLRTMRAAGERELQRRSR
jgi:shikimate dehydrogenase